MPLIFENLLTKGYIIMKFTLYSQPKFVLGMSVNTHSLEQSTFLEYNPASISNQFLMWGNVVCLKCH